MWGKGEGGWWGVWGEVSRDRTGGQGEGKRSTTAVCRCGAEVRGGWWYGVSSLNSVQAAPVSHAAVSVACYLRPPPAHLPASAVCAPLPTHTCAGISVATLTAPICPTTSACWTSPGSATVGVGGKAWGPKCGESDKKRCLRIFMHPLPETMDCETVFSILLTICMHAGITRLHHAVGNVPNLNCCMAPMLCTAPFPDSLPAV